MKKIEFKIDTVKFTFVFVVLFALIAVSFFIASLFLHSRFNNLMGKNENPLAQEFNYDWWYNYNQEKIPLELTEPIPVENINDNSLQIFHVLDKSMLGKTIGFMGKKAKVYVYADQELIYSWKNEGMPKNLKTYGYLCHLVDIPYDTKGQILSIKFDFDVPVDSKINPLDNHFIVGKVLLGKRSEVVYTIAKQGFIFTLFCIIVALMGLVLLIIFLIFRKMFFEDRSILMLSLLNFVIAVWQFENSWVSFVYISNPLYHWAADYLSFLISPLILAVFVQELLDKQHNQYFKIAFCLISFVISVILILQLLGIFAITEFVFVMDILLLFSSLMLLVISFVEAFKRSERDRLFLPAVIALFAAFSSHVLYYLFTGKSSIYFYVFMLFPMYVYVILNVYRLSSHKFKAADERSFYKSIAFKDLASGVYSRSAYYHYIDNFVQNKKYLLFMIDMNNLKIINDEKGHHIGDDVIRFIAESAKQAFRNLGNVYRIGGDEFVVICCDPNDQELTDAVFYFDSLLKNCKEFDFPVSASYGSCGFTATCKDDFYEAQKKADQAMYNMKRKYHIQNDRRCTD